MIQQTGWTSNDTGIWGTVFAFAKEFGWTAHYTLNEVPVYWVRKLFMHMREYADLQRATMKGSQGAQAAPLSEGEKDRRDRLLAEMDGLNYDEIRSDKLFG